MVTILAPTSGFQPSSYQREIFNFVQSGRGHLVVKACAGSGKSTTLVQAAQLLPVGTKSLFAAFNNHIAKELGSKLVEAGSDMECRTVHSLGKSVLDRNIRTQKVEGRKYSNLCRDYLQTKNIVNMQIANQMSKLVDAVRLTLTGPDELNLITIINHYGMDDVEIGDYGWLEMVDGIPQVLEAGKKLYMQAGIIDFTDMLYLPIALNLPCPKYDVLMLDECQDFNAAQLALIMRCCSSNGRMFFVGDESQAIQGFAFADTNSVQNIIDKTQAQVRPLSISYRCAKEVVYMASQLVASIEPNPTAIDGSVASLSSEQFITTVQPGDMVICRTTAPLVEKCLLLLRVGIKAVVRGKDIGKSFIDMLAKLRKRRGFALETLGDLVDAYRYEQINVLINVPDSEMKIATLEDKVDTFIALYEAYLNKANGQGSIVQFEEYIQSFFTDDEEHGVKPVMFSTVHKSKGLEANRVFILRPDLLPHPAAKKDWQIEQERNIEYVAITRAKKELYFVDGLPSNLHFRQAETVVVEQVIENASQIVSEAQEAVEIVATSNDTSKPEKRPYGGRKALADEDKRVFFQQTWDTSVRAAFKEFTEQWNASHPDNKYSEAEMLEAVLLGKVNFASFFYGSEHERSYNDRQDRAMQKRIDYKHRNRSTKKIVKEENNQPDPDDNGPDGNGGGIPAASNDKQEVVETAKEEIAVQAIVEAPGQIQRIAYTCLRPSCHKSWLTDYYVSPDHTLYRYEDGHVVYASMDFPECPYCKNKRQYIKVNRPKMTHSSKRKCDSRCWNAHPGSECRCACGGTRHGLGESGNTNMIGQPLLHMPE